MERRKILLGSGAALATALAGCSSETSDDDPDNDDGNGSSETNSGNGNGNETDPQDDTNGTGETDVDDVPGFDGTKLDLGTDAVEISKIERKGDEVSVVATSEVTDFEELYPELTTMADDLKAAVDDFETFAGKIKTLEWTLDHDGKQVVSFYVDVAWLVDYHDGELDADEFLEKVKETAE